MAKLNTFCGNCCFYNKSAKNCEHGLIEIFQKRNAEIIWEDSGPKIDRICQYKRLENWELDKSKEEKVKISKQEVYIAGTIILLADDKDELLSSIQLINNSVNIQNFKIIVLYEKIAYKDMLDVCGNNIKCDYKCVKMNFGDIELQIYKSLKFAKNGYLFILECKKKIDPNLIDKVDNYVNKKFFRLLHIKGSDGLHESVSMIHLYKWLKGDLEMNFAEKIKDISEQENSENQISTWKEINEEYNS